MSLGLNSLVNLRTEFLARGFSYLSNTRANRYISLGYYRLCAEYEWPFLESSTSGTAPITLTDLNRVEAVINTTSELKLLPLDRRIVADLDPALDDTGTAEYYYIRGGTSTAVKVYPANTSDTFFVRYFKFPADLTTDASIPVVPERWQYIILEDACRKAYQDSDNPSLSQMCEEEYQRGLVAMLNNFALQQVDRPDEIEVLASEFTG